ncbi:MAG: hypothetical protein HC880_10385 [Bacteroidia bacterium]|nr:hypothetical protein [Bacteroidia bacterium]
MNPAVTLSFLQLDRIRWQDAIWYILAQFAGGALAIFVFKWFFGPYISDISVNDVVTVPGTAGSGLALLLERLLSFSMFLMVLWSSNHLRLAPYTGYLVGVLLSVFSLRSIFFRDEHQPGPNGCIGLVGQYLNRLVVVLSGADGGDATGRVFIPLLVSENPLG